MIGLSAIGVILFFLYPIFVIAISIYVSRNKEMTVENYFFANRKSYWVVLGGTFLATCLYSPYILGLTPSFSGMPLFYGLFSVVMIAVLGWFLAPVYLKSKINTFPEYFEKRFGRNFRFMLSGIYIFNNIFIRMVIVLVLGRIFISAITGVDAYSYLLFFLVITGVCVIIGGLRAETYINMSQLLIVILIASGFTFWVVTQKNGINVVADRLTSLSYFGTGANKNLSWLGSVLGISIVSFWFWCADQFIVQKVLSLKNSPAKSIKKGSIFSLALQIVPMLIFVLPGIVFLVFFQNLPYEDSIASLFSGGIMPDILRGGLVIAVVAILVSSFAGLFNSTASLITFDFYGYYKPGASDRMLVLVGRMTTLILLFFSILLIPVSQGIDFVLCLTLIKFFAYTASMISSLFIISLVNKKIKGQSVILSVSASLLVIVIKTMLEIFSGNSSENNIIGWFANSDFTEFSVFIFLLTGLFLYAFNVFESVNLAPVVVYRKLKHEWSFHKIYFLILSVLIMIVIVGIILI